jgi:REP element-mobilizing transposase RayT
MSEKYKFFDPAGMYFTTTTVVGWVDLFTRPQLKNVMLSSLKYCQLNKGLIIHSWCLMPSHLHSIVSTRGESLSNIFRDFKKFTAREIIGQLGSLRESRRGWIADLFSEVGDSYKRVDKYKIWQDGNHPIYLFDQRIALQKLNYIHNNPVVDGTVSEPEHYLYSSARDYAGMKGLLDVEMIEGW